jgi:hypothetical protein
VGELEAASRSQKRAKLTASQVKEIRERLHGGERNTRCGSSSD